jgi:hypothetical protein
MVKDIISQYQGSSQISAEEAQSMLAEIKAKDPTFKVTEYGCELSSEDEELEAHFAKTEERFVLQQYANGVWFTASYFFITFRGKDYKVETDGPFAVELEGIEEVIEEDNE